MKTIERLRVSILIAVTLVAGAQAFADSSMAAIDKAIATADYARALELLETRLAATPQDTALRLRRARVYGYAGNYTAALDELDALRQEYPHDVDYVLARARILARQGRNDAALDDLRYAATIAPHYEDVWELRYWILAQRPDVSAKLERDAIRQEAAARFPASSWWQLREEEDSDLWSVVAGGGYENLDNDLPSWNQQFVEVSRNDGSAWQYRAGVARDERFNSADVSLSLGGAFAFGSDWSTGLDITLVDQADFQPDYSYGVYSGKSWEDGWALTLRYRRREYETATVGSLTSLVEKYLSDFRIAYALGISHLHGESNSLSHGLTFNWYYNDRSSIGISFNAGEEAESISPGQVLETDVRGVTLRGRRKISDRLSLDWWLGLHEQGEFYRRQYLGMAVSIRI